MKANKVHSSSQYKVVLQTGYVPSFNMAGFPESVQDWQMAGPTRHPIGSFVLSLMEGLTQG